MLNVYSAVIWICSIILVSFSVILYLMNDKRSSRALVGISTVLAFWAAMIGGIFWATTPGGSLLFMRASQFGGSLLALSVFVFCHFIHSEKAYLSRKTIGILATIQILFTYGYFFTGLFTKEMLFTGTSPLLREAVGGALLPVHYLYMIILAGFGIAKLLNKPDEKNKEDHGHTKNILRVFATGLIPVVSVLLLVRVFNRPHLLWTAPIAALAWIPAASYSLIKFKVVPTRLFLGQIAVLTLSTILFANIFIGDNVFGATGRILIFLSFEIIGLFFIYLLTHNDRQAAYLTRITTELRAANEQLSQANTKLKKLDVQRSKFVSIASHQLRAPLTAIIGYSSMIIEGSYGKMPKKAEIATEKIFRSGKNLMNVINDFLDISTIEIGQMHFVFAPVELGALALSITQELQANIQMAGLDIRLAIPHGAQFWATADKDKMRHVIINLIDNAIRYTPKGFIEVSLRAAKGQIILTVTDSGIGITSEGLASLFQQFSRAENAGSVNAEGVGLGLYLAREIMKAHKGSIRAESEGTGKGSRFIIELPEVSKTS